MKVKSYSRFMYDLELKSLLQTYESSNLNAKLRIVKKWRKCPARNLQRLIFNFSKQSNENH